MKKHYLFVSAVCILSVLLLSFRADPLRAATSQEIQDSIHNGMSCLALAQDVDGSWGYPFSQDRVAIAGLAVMKLEQYAIFLGYESPFDPGYIYSENVVNGFKYIFSHAGNYGPGSGLCFGKGPRETYNTAAVMMAIISSRDPNRLAVSGNPMAHDKTFFTITQLNVNFFDWSQNPDGGWGAQVSST